MIRHHLLLLLLLLLAPPFSLASRLPSFPSSAGTGPTPWTLDMLDEATRVVVGEVDAQVAALELQVSAMVGEVERRIRDSRQVFDNHAADLVRTESALRMRVEAAEDATRRLLEGARERLAEKRAGWHAPAAALVLLLSASAGLAAVASARTPRRRRERVSFV